MEGKHNLFMEIFLQFHPKVLNVEVIVIVGNAYDVWRILNIYLNKSIQIDKIESYIYAYIFNSRPIP